MAFELELGQSSSLGKGSIGMGMELAHNLHKEREII